MATSIEQEAARSVSGRASTSEAVGAPVFRGHPDAERRLTGGEALALMGTAVALTAGTIVGARLRAALEELSGTGALTGSRSRRISARVDPGLIEAAKRRTGLEADSDVINAALAVLAAGDDFGAWLVSQSTPFPEDFELAI